MTLTEIRRQPMDRVRAFVDKFARTADLRDQKTVDLLHEARHRLQIEYGRQWLARARGRRP